MSEIVKNLFSNYLARFFNVLVSILLVPLNIKLIGVESYGLIGFYTTLAMCLAPLDFGLGVTVKREMARLSTSESNQEKAADFSKTIERIFWGTALVLSLILALFAPFISKYWIQTTLLSEEKTQISVYLMAVALGFQWPLNFYILSLTGLQKQRQLNLVTILMGILNAIGSYLILRFFSPTTEAYFVWSAFSNGCTTLILHFLLWSYLPTGDRAPKFRKEIIDEVKEFALGVCAINLSAVVLINIDRILISALLPLEQFSFFFLVTTFAKSIGLISSPIYTSYLPPLSQAVALNDEIKLREVYHQGCRFLSLMVIPVGLILTIFSAEILKIWLGDRLIPEEYIHVASIYTVGSILNGLMVMPYALQLSLGWTRLNFYQNLVSIAILVPLLFLLILKKGAIGGSITWFALNLGYLLTVPSIMHAKTLKNDMRKWYLNIIRPSMLCLMVMIPAHRFFPYTSGSFFQCVYISVVFSLCFLLTAVSFPEFRSRPRYA
jgi:O-antigen/teichoic acid export membrane protein